MLRPVRDDEAEGTLREIDDLGEERIRSRRPAADHEGAESRESPAAKFALVCVPAPSLAHAAEGKNLHLTKSTRTYGALRFNRRREMPR